MPSLNVFIKRNRDIYEGILLGVRLSIGFTSCFRLIAISILRNHPNSIVKKGSKLDNILDILLIQLSRKIKIKVGKAKFFVNNLEDLTILNPNFESFMKNWFTPRKNDVFIDIGSHIGKYSIPTAMIVGQNGSVISIEPHPETFRSLQKNIALNNVNNLVAFNLGAWNCSQKLDFYFGGTPSEFSIDQNNSKKSIKIQAKKMDDLVFKDLQLKRVDWIKIDAEKAEAEVLQGLEKTLITLRPKLFIEVWSENVNKVKALMNKHGYDLIMVSNALGPVAESCVYFVCYPSRDH